MSLVWLLYTRTFIKVSTQKVNVVKFDNMHVKMTTSKISKFLNVIETTCKNSYDMNVRFNFLDLKNYERNVLVDYSKTVQNNND